MNQLQLFLPCAAGVEDFLAQEVHEITGLQGEDLRVMRGGVNLRSSWRDAMRLNLYSRLCQRVLVQLHVGEYRNEQDLYEAASNVAWEIWFTPKESFKIEITAQHSPLQSLNFAALKIKDAIADRFRFKTGIRPDVNTQWPDARIYAHLTTDTVTIYIDTSGEPLFKRGWRQDTGEAPLKETLAPPAAGLTRLTKKRANSPRFTTPAAAAARLPLKQRKSPATSPLVPPVALVLRSSCRTSPTSGMLLKVKLLRQY
jgi:putative N6-adenine-specific DNA methylase